MQSQHLEHGLAVFPLLRHVDSYQPCHTDLITDADAREYWLRQFRTLMPMQMAAAESIGVPESARNNAADAFLSELDQFEQCPSRSGQLNILLLDTIRQQILFDHGIVDEFRLIKQRENAATLPLLADWLKNLDGLDVAQRIELILRGMLAGNLFDMGAEHTAREFAGANVPFDAALQRVPDRPWYCDGVEMLITTWQQRPWRKAIIFADNAGADATLGVLPLARELLRTGTEVIITANDKPTWNDITIDELRGLLSKAASIDPIFTSPQLRTIANGTVTPLIDLRQVNRELADISTDADLLVLVGMGRSIESNWQATFSCDCLRVAMLKDPHTAQSVGGSLFDAVARFDPAA